MVTTLGFYGRNGMHLGAYVSAASTPFTSCASLFVAPTMSSSPLCRTMDPTYLPTQNQLNQTRVKTTARSTMMKAMRGLRARAQVCVEVVGVDVVRVAVALAEAVVRCNLRARVCESV